MTHLTKIRQCAGLLATAALLVCGGTATAQQKRVAIANFGEHPQLNAAVDGFKRAMAQNGFVDGKEVLYSLSHTNFDATLVPQMISKLQAGKPDLMLTVTTPVSQIAKKAMASSGIPIVFSAVTDPVAAKLVPSWTEGDSAMTGASDLQDIAAVLTFTRQLMPNVKSVGLPYNPGEANDVANMETMKISAAAAGLTMAAVGIDNVNDIAQRMTSLRGKADVVYLISSNLLQPAVAAVAASGRGIGIPVINSDDGPVRTGVVLASFSINYEQVGFNAGVIAARILKGAAPKSIAPSRPGLKDHMPVISRKALASFNMTLPASLANCNCLVD